MVILAARRWSPSRARAWRPARLISRNSSGGVKMTTESEVKLARYSTIEKEADEFGRVIGVRRLKPSEQTKVSGFCADLTGSDEMISETGAKILIPHRVPLVVAAAVCMI